MENSIINWINNNDILVVLIILIILFIFYFIFANVIGNILVLIFDFFKDCIKNDLSYAIKNVKNKIKTLFKK